ncbi:Gfo/Idh/MocA family protein [Aeribacillus alveayuensis]|uniref:Dehydrogenase n=1 Tax=Aeribacillus alveayuensis TaxID=279215 RepID=A0ABT9VNF4_9BACI|nr:putative dehydrogenase [Bacillus alveayuensis]
MRVGVIGTGVMGENHVRVYSSLAHDCELIGVYDIDKNRANQVANQYKINSFANLDDLLQQVDAVSIAVPTIYHYEIGLRCIQNKVHILMEKPITSTVYQAKDLIKKANEAGVILQVGHIELYNPTIEVLKKIVENEEVISIDIHRMSPSLPRNKKIDVVQDLMIHDIYILYELLNDQIEHFYALGKIFENTTKHAMVISKFKSGVIAQLTSSFQTEEKIRTIRINTKKAFIQADLLDKKILITRSTNFYFDHLKAKYSQQNIIEKIVIPEKEPLKLQLLDFITCTKNKTTPTVTGEDGLTALCMTNQIIQFIKDHHKT